MSAFLTVIFTYTVTSQYTQKKLDTLSFRI